MSDLLCPTDGTTLRRIERSGVHVDACPSCRGVWLDRGELDKIVQREQANDAEFEREIRGDDDRDRDRGHSGGGHHSGGYGKPYKKKRSSILGEFLDFG